MSALARLSIVATVILILGAVAAAFYVQFSELDRAHEELRATQFSLGSTQSELDEVKATMAQLQTALTERESTINDLTTEKERLENEGLRLSQNLTQVSRRNDELVSLVTARNILLSARTAALRATETDLRRTSDSLTATSISLAETQDDLMDTQATLAEVSTALESEKEHNSQLVVANTTLESQKSALEDNKLALESELKVATRKYEDLVERAGNRNQLQAQIDALQIEISRLQNLRRPLILQPGELRRGGFLCTGSMEPLLTCLDEATWLTDFDPADIVVGSTISFSPSCWGSKRGTAHRVKKIEIRDGEYYFWPRGDNNRADDGCWVPASNVRGYITDFHRNVRPENAELRNSVNSAVNAYRLLLDTHCGSDVVSYWDCSADDDSSLVWSAYQRARCWVQSARDSEYPGQIPSRCGGLT